MCRNTNKGEIQRGRMVGSDDYDSSVHSAACLPAGKRIQLGCFTGVCVNISSLAFDLLEHEQVDRAGKVAATWLTSRNSISTTTLLTN